MTTKQVSVGRQRQKHTFDDERSEIGNTAVWNVANRAEEKEEVELDVEKGLKNLVRLRLWVSHKTSTWRTPKGAWRAVPEQPDCGERIPIPRGHVYLEMLVFNTCLVVLQPLHRNPLLSLVQKLGRHWGIGHENKDDNTPNTTQGTDDEKFVSPRSQSTFDVADAIAEKSTKGNTGSVSRIPEADLQGLLFPRIPLSRRR